MNHNLCDEQRLIDVLQADAAGSMNDRVGRETVEHLDSCIECQQRLEQLAAQNDTWQTARKLLPTSDQIQSSLGSELRFSQQIESPHNTHSLEQFLSPPTHPELLGRIGRYDVERIIGSGGMGVVFKAIDSELHRAVAIKFLAPHLSERGSARQRFEREARAAAAVMNEHVVAIHNVESGQGAEESSFLVMEYIAGGSLQQRIDSHGPMELCEILRIGMHTARGLAAAHAQGLIHRDVKPSNILLDEGVERALLTDFGLARAEDEACLTRSGMHPGTPHYMSPEQVRGDAIDTRSDLFSLGCVLYALCTGHPPFRAESSYTVLRRITDENPRSIQEINAAIPTWMEQIVFCLLEKNPENRIATAQEVAKLLEGCLAHAQNPATAPLPSLVKVVKEHKVRRPKLLQLLTATALGALFLLATVTIVLELKKGTLVITSDADDVPIQILNGDKVYDELILDRAGQSLRVSAGQYTIVLKDDFEKLKVLNNSVTLQSREEETIRIVKQTVSQEPPRSDSSVQIFAPLDGFLSKIIVPPNQKVSQGQALFQLRNTEIEMQVAQVEGEIHSLRQQLTKPREEQSQQDAPQELLQSQMQSLRQQLEILKERQDQMTIRAPVAGYLQLLPSFLRAQQVGRPVRLGDLLCEIVEDQEELPAERMKSGFDTTLDMLRSQNGSVEPPPLTTEEKSEIAQTREIARTLALQVAALRAEFQYEEAELVEQRMNEMLHSVDPDQRQIAWLRTQIVDARISGEHDEAERLKSEADRLRQELDLRYGVAQRLRREEALAEAMRLAVMNTTIEKTGTKQINASTQPIEMQIYTSLELTFDADVERFIVLDREAEKSLEFKQDSPNTLTLVAKGSPGGAIKIWTGEEEFSLNITVSSEFTKEFIELKTLPPEIALIALSEELTFNEEPIGAARSGETEIVVYGKPETLAIIKQMLVSYEASYVQQSQVDSKQLPSGTEN